MSDIIWEDEMDRGWYKDKNGFVWIISLTPYKEIPIVKLNNPEAEQLIRAIDSKAKTKEKK
jgi:hypothetical protein